MAKKDNTKINIGLSQISDTGLINKKLSIKDLSYNYGGSGTEIYGGVISEEYNSNLQGLNGIDVYEKMRKSDSQIYATLLSMELPIRSTSWFIEAYTNENGQVSKEDEEVKKYVEQLLFEKLEQTRDDLLREIMTMLSFGFSIFEKVIKLEGEKLRLKNLAFRKQKTIDKWKTLEGGPGITQILPNALVDGKNIGQYYISIPAEKLVIFSYRKEGDNYEGVSVLRSAYKNWYIKDKLLIFDSIRQERGAGFPVITLPNGASQKDIDEALNIVQNIRTTHQTGVVLPGADWKFEFANVNAGGNSDIFESIKFHNREISKNILAQFLELGDTQSGSRALSEDQSDLFLLGLEAIAKQIEDTLNRFVIKEMVDLNFDVENYPILKHKKLGSVTYDKLAQVLNTLASSQIITPDNQLESFIRSELDLPAKQEEEIEEENQKEETPIEQQQPNEEVNPEIEEEENISEGEIKEQKKEIETNIDYDEMYFKELSGYIDNKFILELQKEFTEDEKKAIADLKKKGLISWLKFNDFENKAPRPLTFAERKINLTSMKKTLDLSKKVFEEEFKTIKSKMIDDLLTQLKKAIDKNDISKIKDLSIKFGNELNSVTKELQKQLFEKGKLTASTEMGVNIPATKQEMIGAMLVQSQALINKMTADILNDTKQITTEIINQKGGITNTSPSEVIGEVKERLNKSIDKKINTFETLMLQGSLNLGRTTVFEKYPEKVYAMQYSAILDDKTTNLCLSLDGRVVKPGSAEFYKYSPPNHYNCRSIRVEILEDEEFKPKVTGIPKSIPVNRSISDSNTMVSPNLLKNSLAVDIIRQEIEQKQKQLDILKSEGKYQNRQDSLQESIDKLTKSIKGKFIEYIKYLIYNNN